MIRLQRLKNLFKTRKTVLLILLLSILTGFLTLSTLYNPRVLNQAISNVKSVSTEVSDQVTNVSSGEIFREKSTARVWAEGSQLRVQFKVVPEDKVAMAEFNQKLGVDDDYLDGISFELDQESIVRLSNLLPLDLTLSVTGGSLKFDNGVLPGFTSSLITDTIEIATGSGKLNLKRHSASEFTLDVEDPAPLLHHAVTSGQLVLSDKLAQMFPILERVSTIELRVNGKSVNGSFNLK